MKTLVGGGSGPRLSRERPCLQALEWSPWHFEPNRMRSQCSGERLDSSNPSAHTCEGRIEARQVISAVEAVMKWDSVFITYNTAPQPAYHEE